MVLFTVHNCFKLHETTNNLREFETQRRSCRSHPYYSSASCSSLIAHLWQTVFIYFTQLHQSTSLLQQILRGFAIQHGVVDRKHPYVGCSAILLVTQLLFFACLWQKDLSLSRPSSREDGLMAKVTRSQFFIPSALPAHKFHPSSYIHELWHVHTQINLQEIRYGGCGIIT